MDRQESPEFKPPYGSFQTFWAFIGGLAARPLPPQIDRSMFNGKSGSDQVGILMALKGFGLIEGPQQTVQPALEALVAADPESRKGLLAPILRSRYPEQFKVSDQNGTEKMLLDSFEEQFGLTGDTRRKAATFFLHAARTAGLTLSPNFPVTRTGPGAPAGSRAKKTATKRRLADRTTTPPKTNEGGADRFTVNLRAGGSVTLIVDVGHFALSRHKEDREFVQELMDSLTAYGEGGSVAETTDGEEADD